MIEKHLIHVRSNAALVSLSRDLSNEVRLASHANATQDANLSVDS